MITAYIPRQRQKVKGMPSKLLGLIETLANKLRSQQQRLATAESCTGGGLSYWLTALPGSSDWFDRGFVTYSNDAKIAMLSVDPTILGEYGAVSAETARAMAEGALLNSIANVSVAITGIAGPDGGSEEKPVGTVWIGWSQAGKETLTRLFTFHGDRNQVREQSITAALEQLIKL